jgi:manganese transport system permease protein
MLEWLLAPLQFEFMVRAILVSGVVGGVCAMLSCYMILKGWALMGDAVSHAVLPGVVLAYALNLPYAIGAFGFGMGSVFLIGFIQQQSRIKEDTAIGLVFTGFFALGLILVSKVPSNVDLSHILFGNPLGVPDAELLQTLIASAITIVVIGLLRKDLMLFCFDPIHASSIGLNTAFLYYLLLTLLSLTIVAALQTVGVVLVIAMLITPGATAYLWCDRFDKMMLIAVTIGIVGSVVGTYISYYLDASTGGCIVVLQTILFLLSLVFAPKHGLIARQLT